MRLGRRCSDPCDGVGQAADLGEEAFVGAALVQHELVGRHQDASAMRLQLARLREEGSPAPVRHVLVREHDVERSRTKLRERLDDARRHLDLDVSPERSGEVVADDDVIVDDQHSHRALGHAHRDTRLELDHRIAWWSTVGAGDRRARGERLFDAPGRNRRCVVERSRNGGGSWYRAPGPARGLAEEPVSRRTVNEKKASEQRKAAAPIDPRQLELVLADRAPRANGVAIAEPQGDDADRARAILTSLGELSSEEVFAAFEELDALPRDVVRAVLAVSTGPLPDPELLDDAIRRAHGFPPRALRLQTIAIVKDADIFDIGPVGEEQVRIAGTSWDGRDLPAEERLDEEIEGSFAGTLERHTLAEAGEPRFDVLRYAGDAGAIFRAGTAELVGAIAYDTVEMKDRRARVAIQDALARGLVLEAIKAEEPTTVDVPEETAREVLAPRKPTAKRSAAKATRAASKTVVAKEPAAKTAASKAGAKKKAASKAGAKKKAASKAGAKKAPTKKIASKASATAAVERASAKKATVKTKATRPSGKRTTAAKPTTKKASAKKASARKAPTKKG